MNNPAGSHTSGSANGLRRSAALRNGEAAHAYESWPLSELICHIVARHHTWLRAELPEIARLIHQTIASEGRALSGRFIEIEKLFRQFQRETENHLKKEEAVLFPLIERLEARAASGLPPERQSFGSLSNPVQFMMEDHELADRLLEKMKELAGESGASEEATAARRVLLERLKAVEEDLAIHVRLEDEVLFPRAIRLEENGESPGL
ncbi:MAG: hemerythrin domain-containing protein [Acidobacteriota bacterium]|nr:hemerythrin domain-containing protein [Acidobacteriota bacterium]